jgi:hypothetical protein
MCEKRNHSKKYILQPKLSLMSDHGKHIAGVILITIPTIQYGGYFLLTVLSGKTKAAFTDFQKAMFRAGHAHAGVLVILAIIAQFLIDNTNVSAPAEWFLRLGFPLAAILISGGFFAAAAGKNATKPNSFISILYAGAILLAAALIFLGIALIAG